MPSTHRAIAFFVMVLSLTAASASAGPVNGAIGKRADVPSKKPDAEPSEYTYSIDVECKGNEKTSVLIVGDHRPVTDLELEVYEMTPAGVQGKLIARVKETRDVVGVVFTPARQGQYRILVRNPSAYHPRENPYNEAYLSIK